MGYDGGEIAWQEYKMVDNRKSRGRLSQAHLLGSQNVSRKAIGDADRMYKWEADAEQMGVFRYVGYHEVSRLRRKLNLPEKSMEKPSEDEIDTDSECEPVGMTSDKITSGKGKKDIRERDRERDRDRDRERSRSRERDRERGRRAVQWVGGGYL